jgi:hypothetical protein
MTTATDLEAALQDVTVALDGLLPALGHGELVPLVNLATKLAQTLLEALAAKDNAATVLTSEVSTADAAADAAEKAKFP